MKWFPLLAILFFVNCPNKQAVQLRYSERGTMYFRTVPIIWSFSCIFPEEGREPIRNGINYWNKSLSRPIFQETTDCGVSEMLDRDSSRLIITYVEGSDVDSPVTLATTNVGLLDGYPKSGVIKFYGTWRAYESQAAKESVARHEAGHVLGFGHSEVLGCLMYPTIDMDRYSEQAKEVCREELDEAMKLYNE